MKRAVAGSAVALVWAATLHGQQPGAGFLPLGALCGEDAGAGSAAEATVLAASLVTAPASSTLRPLPAEVAESIIASLRPDSAVTRDCAGPWVRPAGHMWYNTTAAHRDRDGAVWQGRGATIAVEGGIRVRRGRVALAVRPLAFITENRRFSPALPARGEDDFRDPLWGHAIDLPYRFGDGVTGAVDPGESYLRVDLTRVGVGVSTSLQHWGPAHYYPLVLGTEGPGYPRVFLEARRLPIGIGTVMGNWHLGIVESSRYTALPVGERSRIASAAMASFTPKPFPGIEIGGARFFHVRRGPDAISLTTATLPFSGLLKTQSSDATVGGYNQLASAFFRVAPGGAGIETYGEFYREDHNADLRDLIGEPDHASAYVLGVRRAWKDQGLLSVLTLEHANGRISHLSRVRPQDPVYTHGSIAEGHTVRGQPLSSSALLGGGGLTIAWSRVRGASSWTLSYARESTAQDREGGSLGGTPSGEHILRYGRTAAGATTYGWAAELSVPYGGVGQANLSVSWSVRPSF